jgi:hypothetical protein
MYIIAQCKACKNKAIFNIGDTPLEEVKELMHNKDFDMCRAGWHRQECKMDEYYIFDWNSVFKTQEQAYSHMNRKLNRVAKKANKRDDKRVILTEEDMGFGKYRCVIK